MVWYVDECGILSEADLKVALGEDFAKRITLKEIERMIRQGIKMLL